MAYWKRLVTQRMPDRSGKLWQSGHWDTQMRTGKAYDEKWEYIRNNPVRRGLADAPEDWPFACEMNPLEWHGP